MLTTTQLEQQDFVDNAIFALLENLAQQPLEWDMEMIADVRDNIEAWLLSKKIISKEEFYPSV